MAVLRATGESHVTRRVRGQWITSSQLQELRIPSGDNGTGLSGDPLGRCVRGGDFVFDPFDAYRTSLVTNPNILVAGVIGVGKSTAVKMLIRRGLSVGRRAVIVDPKGEYGELARSAGGDVLLLEARGQYWFNPFAGRDDEDVQLLATVLGTLRGSLLNEDEHFLLEHEWALLTEQQRTRPLWHIAAAFASALSEGHGSPRRSLALGLRRLVDGDVAGILDGEGSPVSLRSALTVFDVSSLWLSPAFPAIAVATAAVARRLVEDVHVPGYLVLDEAWALVSAPGVAHWLHGSLKLARARGVAHILVVHRWSDVFASAPEGSVQRAQTTSMLRDCESVILLRQMPGDLELLDEVLALHENEYAALSRLPVGGALVRYGSGRSLVRFVPDEQDRRVIDTNAAMLVT